MKQYIVYIPQVDKYALVTRQEYANYTDILKSYDKNLTIDYSDDNLPFYNLDRLIDDFSVKDAIKQFNLATEYEISENIEDKIGTLEDFAFKQYRNNRVWIEEWFSNFDEMLKLKEN